MHSPGATWDGVRSRAARNRWFGFGGTTTSLMSGPLSVVSLSDNLTLGEQVVTRVLTCPHWSSVAIVVAGQGNGSSLRGSPASRTRWTTP
jgi:hypothetical protein